jgi:hypothetical protein
VRLCGDDVRLLAVVTALVIWRRELVLVDGLEPERILGAPPASGVARGSEIAGHLKEVSKCPV